MFIMTASIFPMPTTFSHQSVRAWPTFVLMMPASTIVIQYSFWWLPDFFDTVNAVMTSPCKWAAQHLISLHNNHEHQWVEQITNAVPESFIKQLIYEYCVLWLAGNNQTNREFFGWTILSQLFYKSNKIQLACLHLFLCYKHLGSWVNAQILTYWLF